MKLPAVKLPVVVLGFSPTQLLVVTNGAERIMPIFTDPEAAHAYHQHYNNHILEHTLTITAGPPSSELSQLDSFVVDKLQPLLDLLSIIIIKNGMIYFTINPPIPPGDNKLLCLEVDELFEMLKAETI